MLRGGAKLAGVLLERLEHGAVLAGIGLNIRHAPADAPYPVTTLAAEGFDPAPETVLGEILASLEAGWAAWQVTGLASVLGHWSQRGPALHSPMRVRLPSGVLQGSFAGLGPAGSLLLDTADGRRTLMAGDVLVA